MLSFKRIVAVIIPAMLMVFSSAQSQKVPITQGTRYMVAFPQVWASASEEPLPNAMQLFISTLSKGTKVRITTPASSNTNARIDKTYKVDSGQVIKVSIPRTYMNEESERITGYGIQVVGTKPISVYSYQSWTGNGELAHHLPIEAWGKMYSTMNFYQDRYGKTELHYRPSQILLVADKDNTIVSYTPTVETEGGQDAQSVLAGRTGMVTLNKGETFLIKAKINESLNKEWATDLSATIIKSNRPVGVVSGHTKVAIMRYPDELPPTGITADAHFVRNNVHDAMLPVEMAGTEFVVVPSMYTPRRTVGNQSGSGAGIGIEDDKGDVVRFNALEDGTVISEMRQDGSGLKNIRTLRKNETLVLPTVEYATYYKASKPVLCGQYGKSWANVTPPVSIGKPSDDVQGHPTIEAGMPMFEMVPSTDRWVTEASFTAPEGLDNFFNITFMWNDVGNITIDGRKLSSIAGGSLRPIQGTPYGQIRTIVGTGDHVIKSIVPTVRWMGWTYGSLDGMQMGRAYGSHMAIDLSIPCDDTIIVDQSELCGNVHGTFTVKPDKSCGFVYTIYADTIGNYAWSDDLDASPLVIQFGLDVIDRSKDAYARIVFVSRSGNVYTRTYAYYAPKLSWTPPILDFGVQPVGTSVCLTTTVRNDGNEVVNVKSVKLKNGTSFFTVTPQVFSINPKDSVTLNVCVTTRDYLKYTDTLVVETECDTIPITPVTVRGQEPSLYAYDRDWGSVPKNSTTTKTVVIENNGSTDVTITGYTPVGGDSYFTNFTIALPITLGKGEKYVYNVDFSPNGVSGVQRTLRVDYQSNAKKTKTYSILNGIGTDAQMSVTDADWDVRVIDQYQTSKGVTGYTNTFTVSNFGNTVINVDTVYIDGVDNSYFVIGNVFDDNGGRLPRQVPISALKYPITVTFVPNEVVNTRLAERMYNARVVVKYRVNGEQKEAYGNLVGKATLPRLSAVGYDWGTVSVGYSGVSQVYIRNVDDSLTNSITGNTDGSMTMELYKMTIPQNYPFVWTQTGTKTITYPSPIIVPSGDEHAEFVTFNPTSVGSWSVPFQIDYNGSMTANPLLVGATDMTNKLSATDVNLLQWFSNDTVGVVNVTSDLDAVVDISSLNGQDAVNFSVLSPTVNQLVLKAGVPQQVTVKFSPPAVTQNGLAWGQNLGNRLPYRISSYTSNIQFTDVVTGQSATSTIVGDGKYLETTALIREDYKTQPDQTVNVMVELDSVPQRIDSGFITQFRVRVGYDSDMLHYSGIILQSNTQTDGWTVLAKNATAGAIEIDFKDTRTSKTPLTNNGVPVFGLQFVGMLSDHMTATFPLEMYWVDIEAKNEENRQYVVFNNKPGKIENVLKCAGLLRLIRAGSTTYFIETKRDRLNSTMTIRYGVGISAPVKIRITNLLGQTVDVIDGYQPNGEYEIQVDMTTLPRGIYFVTMVSVDYMSNPMKFVKE